jgi:hypothetical protein
MDQATYNSLWQQRQTNQLGDATDPASDAAAFDRQAQSGAYAPFEQARGQTAPPLSQPPPSAPPGSSTPGMRPQQPIPDLPMPGMRPQQEIAQYPDEETTAPRGMLYRDVQRDWQTGYGDRLGLDPLNPRDTGDPQVSLGTLLTPQGLSEMAKPTELMSRALTTLENAPGRIMRDPVRSLVHGAGYALSALPSAQDAAIEEQYGLPTADKYSPLTHLFNAGILGSTLGPAVWARMPTPLRYLTGYEILRHLFASAPRQNPQNLYGPSQAPNPQSGPLPGTYP